MTQHSSDYNNFLCTEIVCVINIALELRTRGRFLQAIHGLTRV